MVHVLYGPEQERSRDRDKGDCVAPVAIALPFTVAICDWVMKCPIESNLCKPLDRPLARCRSRLPMRLVDCFADGFRHARPVAPAASALPFTVAMFRWCYRE